MALYKILKTAVKEADVEHIYRNFLTQRPVNSELPFVSRKENIGIDGLFSLSDFMMLLEFKYDKDFTKRSNVIEVIVQILYYLKRFEEFGEDPPDVCFVGDINECFCFHANNIVEYLSLDTEWSLAPSEAGRKNTKLFKLLYDDQNINPFVHELDDDFKIGSLLEEAIDLSKNIVQKKRITEKNINRLFGYFTERVLRGKKLNDKTTNELVNIFITAILNKNQNYIHPHKPNTLVSESFGNVLVNGNIFKSFFKHYQRDYSIKERDRLAGICDRLIEDTTRRFQGEFFTPTEWVDEAHKMITAEFGEDWKEKYVVWDPAWGTGNLTRDYKFKELYCSTLNKSDLDIAEQMGYNPEATKFQFDFLNDTDDKLPLGLQLALKQGKDIIVLMNPPYGAATEFGTKSKAKVTSKTIIRQRMIDKGLQKAVQQLYTQFLFRIQEWNRIKNSDISIGIFSPPLFFSGISFKLFREAFTKNFEFVGGFLLNANNFANVKSWGISFSLWQPGIQKHNTITLSVLELSKHGKPEKVSTKKIYNCDFDNSASNWVREPLKNVKTVNCPQMTSGIKVKTSGKTMVGRMASGCIGYSFNGGNSVYTNPTEVSLFSSAYSMGHGFSVIDLNFDRVIALFTARKTIKSNWINQKDEYLAPNTEHPDYKQWNNDCLVYSLFNNSSNQSSLRDITYKDKQWDIINEWFWMSNDEIKGWAEDHVINEIELDCKNFSGERFVYKKLQETTLSDDAKEVLRMAESLVIKSLQYRRMMIEEHPEYHLDTWDAGWYQIKLTLKKYLPDDLKTFVKLYKEFENRMRKGVYKFGFLRE